MDPRRLPHLLPAALALALGVAGACASTAAPPPPRVLATIAVRVHHLDAMVAFYSEAFGVTFREVDARGVRSMFGELDGRTLKLVPIRATTDFEGYPSHQLGFEVADVPRVIRLAEQHGGRREGPVLEADGRVHAAVRDPDGNTIELYGPAGGGS